MTDLDTVKQLYPQCAQAGANLSEVFVAVHAAVKGNGLTYSSTVRLTFGLSMWVSLVSHAFGVEIYVRMIRTLLITVLHKSYVSNFWPSRSERLSF
jgi:hypothetical protein